MKNIAAREALAEALCWARDQVDLINVGLGFAGRGGKAAIREAEKAGFIQSQGTEWIFRIRRPHVIIDRLDDPDEPVSWTRIERLLAERLDRPNAVICLDGDDVLLPDEEGSVWHDDECIGTVARVGRIIMARLFPGTVV